MANPDNDPTRPCGDPPSRKERRDAGAGLDDEVGDEVGDEGPVLDLASDLHFMSQALRQARRALAATEVPVGAVVVREGRIIARAHNQVETLTDATAHAEMLALTQAQSVIGDWRLVDCDLFVTKEPCPMCAGAIVHCRVRRVVFGCPDPKGGACGGFVNLLHQPSLNHRCEITSGVLCDEAADLLRGFFAEARAARKSAASASASGSVARRQDEGDGVDGDGFGS